jgi:hypothetical protein
MNEQIERLKIALPHLFCAFRDAMESGQPVITIASQQPDGSGQMFAVINEPEQFLADIASVAGLEYPPTEEHMSKYKAEVFLQKWGLK